MRRIAFYFFRGLLVTAPAVLTVYLCWVAIRWVDTVVGTSIPGLGVVIAVLGITGIGFLASNFFTSSIVAGTDRLLAKLPFVRILYTSIKDLLGAMIGEQRRFNRPVKARFGEGPGAFFLLGFVTSDSLPMLGEDGFVSVYVPFSYSFAGHIVLVPADRVVPISADATDALAFILSGGVTRSAADRSPG